MPPKNKGGKKKKSHKKKDENEMTPEEAILAYQFAFNCHIFICDFIIYFLYIIKLQDQY